MDLQHVAEGSTNLLTIRQVFDHIDMVGELIGPGRGRSDDGDEPSGPVPRAAH